MVAYKLTLLSDGSGALKFIIPVARFVFFFLLSFLRCRWLSERKNSISKYVCAYGQQSVPARALRSVPKSNVRGRWKKRKKRLKEKKNINARRVDDGRNPLLCCRHCTRCTRYSSAHFSQWRKRIGEKRRDRSPTVSACTRNRYHNYYDARRTRMRSRTGGAQPVTPPPPCFVTLKGFRLGLDRAYFSGVGRILLRRKKNVARYHDCDNFAAPIAFPLSREKERHEIKTKRNKPAYLQMFSAHSACDLFVTDAMACACGATNQDGCLTSGPKDSKETSS